jgi:hypothetical protein
VQKSLPKAGGQGNAAGDGFALDWFLSQPDSTLFIAIFNQRSVPIALKSL